MDFTPNIVEIYTLYGIGSCLIFARIACRTKLVGVRGWHPDDYIIFLSWALYTAVTVVAHVFIIVAGGKHTSLLTHDQRRLMPPSQVPAWVYGSKIFMLGQMLYASIVWSLKFNMLFFYRRITRGLWVEKLIIPTLAFVAMTGIAVLLVFTCTCRPFYKLWQVWPDPGDHCEPQNYVFFLSVLLMNMVTDLIILLIPVPVIAPLHASLPRRLGLYALFGLGVFCMIAAVLRVVFVFALNQSGISAMWSIREDFVAVFVGQAPMVRPIFSRGFWTGGDRNDSYGKGSKAKSFGNRSAGIELDSNPDHSRHSRKGSSAGFGGKKKDPYSVTQIMSESQEEIVAGRAGDLERGRDAAGDDMHLTVEVKRVVHVESRETTPENKMEQRVEGWV
ncbi:uncharacterized protein BKCO1_2500010 [Diplodia corticola]|uniref:Rhodopsin domain-containing protein n=1 Tax=Diplodia corticola TaxID=236234 RepID=A0A1J9R1E3_9PEZI|nr:uncharacterized protein BKCO1_2500010 [Diplodia corticola]OJD34058.1 hypothetical protein BKCO1_2500010 [Diplodia corticola]